MSVLGQLDSALCDLLLCRRLNSSNNNNNNNNNDLGAVHILYNKKCQFLTPPLPHITLYNSFTNPPEII